MLFVMSFHEWVELAGHDLEIGMESADLSHQGQRGIRDVTSGVPRIGSSLVPCPRAPPGEKRSGERSRISWAYYPKRVMTNEIARSVIIT